MSEYRLGDLQLRIMQVLWQEGGRTVADVHAALRRQTPDDRQLAYTTIATMLRKMEDRGAASAADVAARGLADGPLGDGRFDRRRAGRTVVVRIALGRRGTSRWTD